MYIVQNRIYFCPDCGEKKTGAKDVVKHCRSVYHQGGEDRGQGRGQVSISPGEDRGCGCGGEKKTYQMSKNRYKNFLITIFMMNASNPFK